MIAAAAALIAAPVWAADEAKPDQDQSIKLSPVALPIVVDGRVVNYIFVEARLRLTSSADAVALRDKEPYFRDALVRAAYRTPFGARNDPNYIDEGRLRAVLYREAVAIAGPHMIQSAAVDSQTPQHHLFAAQPAPPARPPLIP
jgi:hypothetical protein